MEAKLERTQKQKSEINLTKTKREITTHTQNMLIKAKKARKTTGKGKGLLSANLALTLLEHNILSQVSGGTLKMTKTTIVNST
jgi:hypothetical protein